MPRKNQFTADEIVGAAYALVKENGWEGLSVKAVAEKIGSSTMPIYSYFENLEKLKDAVVEKGWERLMEYETREYTGDTWVDHSLGCIRFAREEKNIFYSMFDGRNIQLQREKSVAHWRFLIGTLQDYARFKGLEKEQIFLIRYSRALFTHGLAVSASINWGKFLEEEGVIENLVTAVSRSLLEGYRDSYSREDENIAFLDTVVKDLFENAYSTLEEEENSTKTD